MGFVVDRLALSQIVLRVLWIPIVIIPLTADILSLVLSPTVYSLTDRPRL